MPVSLSITADAYHILRELKDGKRSEIVERLIFEHLGDRKKAILREISALENDIYEIHAVVIERDAPKRRKVAAVLNALSTYAEQEQVPVKVEIIG